MAVYELRTYVVLCDGCREEVVRVESFREPAQKNYLNRHRYSRGGYHDDVMYLCDSCFEETAPRPLTGDGDREILDTDGGG